MNWWYKKSLIGVLLLPFSLLFLCLVVGRRQCYRWGVFKTIRINVPVVVVGNLTVGGTGKTPMVIALVRYFTAQGYRPVVITRGYKGLNQQWPIKVESDSDPAQVGDEAVLLAQRAECLVYAGPDRVASAREALKNAVSDTKKSLIILSDDGLQHYRLGRDIEIAMVDGSRQFGNGFLLPAGPLREPVSRLSTIDFAVVQDEPLRKQAHYIMRLQGEGCVALHDASVRCAVADFYEKTVHAVAGIGHPERFFKSLEGQGVRVIRHPFSDHHAFVKEDIYFGDDLPVLMTEKDAVKCKKFAHQRHWYLPVEAVLDESFFEQLHRRMKTRVKIK